MFPFGPSSLGSSTGLELLALFSRVPCIVSGVVKGGVLVDDSNSFKSKSPCIEK